MPLITARVDDSAKTQFRQLARSHGQTESEFLRSLLQMLITRTESNSSPVAADPRNSDPCRMTIRVPQFLMNGIAQRAAAKGMKHSRWVGALVQSHLMQAPVLTEVEVQALRASNRELAAIGRNLNQVTRRINEAFHDTEQVRLSLLKQVADAIERHQVGIRILVRASQNSWRAPDEN